MDITKAYAVNNLCYIAAKKMTPQGIVVHSTGANNPNLKRYVDCPDVVGANVNGNHWNTATPGGKKVCVHAFIGYDKNKEVRVVEILPLNICCWGVGSGKKGSYNYNPPYIQFEICEDGLIDHTYYKKAFGVAAEYCAHLCKTFGLSVEQIVGHNEAYKRGYGSNHADPEHWMKRFGETMDDFRNQVNGLLNGNTSISSTTVNKTTSDVTKTFTPYRIKVTTNALNIRKGAGTNTAKVGCIRDKGVYTIVEEKTGVGASLWGKLKSGAGWISLDYAKKIIIY